MAISPRAAVAAALATSSVLAVSACTTNRTPYDFHTWEQVARKDGVELEQFRLPLTRDSGFLTEYTGVYRIDYRVTNENDSPRCVLLEFNQQKGVSTRAAPLNEPTVIRPGQTVDGPSASPDRRRDGEASWRIGFEVSPAYENETSWQCERPTQSSDADCYITTAMCEQTGRADDCHELEVLRAFRDGPLRRMPGGEALIADYYRSAPALVRALDRDPARDTLYRQLREQFIQPAADAAERGQHERARDLYIAMVNRLKARYAQ